MLRHQKLFRQLCVRGARYSGVPQLPAGRPHAPRGPTPAVPSVVSLQPCRAARYACVACRGLGWYLALVALSKQRALLRRATTARYCGSRRATTARHYDTLPRQAAHGPGHAARRSRRLAALRVSFFCVSRAAVLTCFDGDVNSLVSLQGHWKQGVGGQNGDPQNAPSPNLWQIR